MNEDRLTGAGETLGGRATTVTGQLIGDERMVARGDTRQFSGKVCNILRSVMGMLGLHRQAAISGSKSLSSDHSFDPNSNFIQDVGMNGDRIEGSLRNVKGKVERGVGDVTSDTKWQAEGVIDQVAGTAQNLYGRAKDTVQDAFDNAPTALADTADRARDVAARGRTLADDQVKDNPWALVAAAGIAGYALAWLLLGKRD